MRTGSPQRKKSASEAVQDARNSASAGMSQSEGNGSTNRSPGHAPVAGDRSAAVGRDGRFSAEAVPLRPAAERTADREREERLRLMTARRLPRLRGPGGPKPRTAIAIAAAAVVLVVVGSIALGQGGNGPAGHGGDGPDGLAAGTLRQRTPSGHAGVVADPPGRDHLSVGKTKTASPPDVARRRKSSRHPGARQDGARRGRRRDGHPAHRDSDSTASAAASVEQEPAPAAPPEPAPVSPPPEPAPVAEPAPETSPASEPPPPPPSTETNEEPTPTPESTAVENQFGFER